MKTGACGVCCQTLSEAEAMVEGGLDDVFISNQVKLIFSSSMDQKAYICLYIVLVTLFIFHLIRLIS